jgi:hypothetical protein
VVHKITDYSTPILKETTIHNHIPYILTSNHASKEFFFVFWPFYIISRNESGEFFSSNLAILSRAGMVGVTHEGVAPVHMARLGGGGGWRGRVAT